MSRIEADIALESWLFGFRPCSGQGQFTLSAPMLPIEPKDHGIRMVGITSAAISVT